MGRVKWFSQQKGFGFIFVDGFESEFLLHLNVLLAGNYDGVLDNSSVEFVPEFTLRGNRVAEIIRLSRPNVLGNSDNVFFERAVASQKLPARVKWFDASKGYGFVNKFGCEKDVFVGAEALTRSGLNSLKSGDAVCIQVKEHDGQDHVYKVYSWLSH
jgi:CspA family cold shock protein